MKVLLSLLMTISLPALAQAVCARTTATLREGPGTSFAAKWKVSKFMPFVRLEQKSGWMKLADMDGDIGYGRAVDFTTRFRCVAVKSNTAETRQGPGTQFPYGEFKTLDRYTPLKRHENKGSWVEVETDIGSRFWVQESKVWRPVHVQSVSF